VGSTAAVNQVGVTMPIVLIALTAYLLNLHRPPLRPCSKCRGRGGTV
jgi:hypothetical protein